MSSKESGLKVEVMFFFKERSSTGFCDGIVFVLSCVVTRGEDYVRFGNWEG